MNKIGAILKNKYAITLIVLSIWVLFFDKNDLNTQIKLRKDINLLEEEKSYYKKEIGQITTDLKELTTNPKTLEKFARENYLMKRENEDIFVIVKEEKISNE